tara:strand:- start:169 stop:780 length:612 start_codon:yes stop_codon:yes gene_type:complete
MSTFTQKSALSSGMSDSVAVSSEEDWQKFPRNKWDYETGSDAASVELKRMMLTLHVAIISPLYKRFFNDVSPRITSEEKINESVLHLTSEERINKIVLHMKKKDIRRELHSIVDSLNNRDVNDVLKKFKKKKVIQGDVKINDSGANKKNLIKNIIDQRVLRDPNVSGERKKKKQIKTKMKTRKKKKMKKKMKITRRKTANIMN